jgi:uncharacterized protein YbaR (Trm112 family)
MPPTNHPSPITDHLLPHLRCPITLQKLRPATPEELRHLDLEAALVTEDARTAYPINHDIPILLPEAARKL